MAISDEKMSRWEKATSLVRNVVFVLAALIPVLMWLFRLFQEPVIVNTFVMNIASSRFVIINRDAVKSSLTNGPVDTTLNPHVGRLDAVGRVHIVNRSRSFVELTIKLENVSRLVDLTPESEWLPLPINQFVLIDVTPSCSIDKTLLLMGDSARINRGATGTLQLKEFPPGCALRMELIHSASGAPYAEVYANGRRVYASSGRLVFGRIPILLAKLTSSGMKGYILILAALALVAYLPLLVVRLLGKAAPVDVRTSPVSDEHKDA